MNKLKQYYMMTVTSVFLLACQLGFWRVLLISRILYESANYSDIVYGHVGYWWISELTNICIYLGIWLFCFRYWKTAYELKFLFYRQSLEEKIKKEKMFFFVNLAGIVSNLVGIVALAVDLKQFKDS